MAGSVILLLPTALAFSALALAQLGEPRQALDRAHESEELLAHLASRGIIGWSGWDYQVLGHAGLRLGRLDDAVRLATRAVECSPSHPAFAAHARHLLGEISAHAERLDPVRGEAHFREAQALAEPRGMRPLVARCQLGLAKLYQHAGDDARAREHLTSAAALCRAMHKDSWLDDAEIAIR